MLKTIGRLAELAEIHLIEQAHQLFGLAGLLKRVCTW